MDGRGKLTVATPNCRNAESHQGEWGYGKKTGGGTYKLADGNEYVGEVTPYVMHVYASACACVCIYVLVYVHSCACTNQAHMLMYIHINIQVKVHRMIDRACVCSSAVGRRP